MSPLKGQENGQTTYDERQIQSREAGHAYLPEFLADYNQRFAEPPRSDVDLHCPLAGQLLPANDWKSHAKGSADGTVLFTC